MVAKGMGFEFATANRIVFGRGAVKQAGQIIRGVGQRMLVVTGANPTRCEPLLKVLAEAGVDTQVFGVPGEPELATVEAGVEAAREFGATGVVGFGGGSALDAGKGIAAMLNNPGTLMDYVEVIGKGQALPNPGLPYVAIPTTAGTGSEVTRNAVLASPEHRVKVSLRSAGMLPRIALVDPELTFCLPREITASTGLDALTQVIEPFVSAKANPLVDGLCREGMTRAARSLRVACDDPENAAAREDMSLTGLFGGLALANAGLGVVHGFAGPIGGSFAAPHGAVCAALLPHGLRGNIRALQQRAPGGALLRRFEEVARLLTGAPAAEPEDGIEWVSRLVQDLGIPRLSRYGLQSSDVPELVRKATQASSMKANPIVLTEEELAEVLTAAL